MVGKFDTYLTYITSDFREEKSLEQEVEAFLDIYGRKGNAAITSDKYQLFPPFNFVIYTYRNQCTLKCIIAKLESRLSSCAAG